MGRGPRAQPRRLQAALRRGASGAAESRRRKPGGEPGAARQRVKSGLDYLWKKLAEKKLDALILIGDDQSENFKEDNLPQIALYVGEEFLATEPGQSGGVRYRSNAALA